MGYSDCCFLLGELEEAVQVYTDALELPSTQENDQPRLYVRIFFAELAMCKLEPARTGFSKVLAVLM